MNHYHVPRHEVCGSDEKIRKKSQDIEQILSLKAKISTAESCTMGVGPVQFQSWEAPERTIEIPKEQEPALELMCWGTSKGKGIWGGKEN